MAQRDGAAVGIHVRGIVGNAELAQHRERLRGERFVELDDVHLRQRQASSRASSFACRRRRADAHDARLRRRRQPRPRFARAASSLKRVAAASLATSSAQAPSLTPEALPAVHCPACTERRRQLRQRLERRLARMLVATRRPSARPSSAGIVTGTISAAKRAARLRAQRALLAAQRERVLVRARHLELGGDVFARLRHRVDAVLLLHQRVHEAPADRACRTSAHRERTAPRPSTGRKGARDMLSTPPGDHELRLARADHARRARDRIEARAAQAVDGRARHSTGQAREQRAMRATLRLSSPAWLAQP